MPCIKVVSDIDTSSVHSSPGQAVFKVVAIFAHFFLCSNTLHKTKKNLRISVIDTSILYASRFDFSV